MEARVGCRLVILALIAFPAVSGCLDPGSGSPEVTGLQEAAAEQGAPATRPPPSNESDPLLFDAIVLAGPAQPITRFSWSIPDGVVRWTDLPDGSRQASAFLDLFPVSPGNVTEFALLAVGPGSSPSILGEWTAASLKGESTINLTETKTLDYPAKLSNRHFTLSAASLAPGDIISFVFAARSAQPQEIVLWLDALPSSIDYAPIPQSVAELARGREPTHLDAAQVGHGLQVSTYLLVNVFYPGQAVEHSEMYSDSVKIATRMQAPTEPLAAVRQQIITTEFSGGGFGSALLLYIAAGVGPCLAMGDYRADIDVHGVTVSQSSIMVPGTTTLSGLALLQASGEGAGGSRVEFEVNATQGCVVEAWVLDDLELGVGFETIVGSRAEAMTVSNPGLLDGFPPSWVASRVVLDPSLEFLVRELN